MTEKLDFVHHCPICGKEGCAHTSEERLREHAALVEEQYTSVPYQVLQDAEQRRLAQQNFEHRGTVAFDEVAQELGVGTATDLLTEYLASRMHSTVADEEVKRLVAHVRTKYEGGRR
ncbi:MAG: hypothetical protein ABIG71_01500 [Candidatus Uhrbacteria bacterium]